MKTWLNDTALERLCVSETLKCIFLERQLNAVTVKRHGDD